MLIHVQGVFKWLSIFLDLSVCSLWSISFIFLLFPFLGLNMFHSLLRVSLCDLGWDIFLLQAQYESSSCLMWLIMTFCFLFGFTNLEVPALCSNLTLLPVYNLMYYSTINNINNNASMPSFYVFATWTPFFHSAFSRTISYLLPWKFITFGLFQVLIAPINMILSLIPIGVLVGFSLSQTVSIISSSKGVNSYCLLVVSNIREIASVLIFFPLQHFQI